MSSLAPQLRLVTAPVAETPETLVPDDRLFAQCREIARKCGMIVEGDRSIRNACIETGVFAQARIVTTFRGDTGTGKDLFPQLYHGIASGSGGGSSYVSVNVAAFNEHMIESELFGHKKGAFTGATADRPSVFVEAGEGTVHLDEIGLLPKQSQSKLLRLIGSREVQQVGSNKPQEVKCCIVCSTNKPLEEMVQKGEFLEDLYWRITEGMIFLPRWLHREDDHKRLVIDSCLEDRDMQIEEGAVRELMNSSLRGNVRELQALVRRAAAFTVLREDGCRRIGMREVQRARQTGGRLPYVSEPAAGPAADNGGNGKR